MKIDILDLNSSDYKIQFPDKSLKFKIPEIPNKDLIVLSISLKTNDDIIYLGLAASTLKNSGVKRIEVVIKYMMYQQDDRLFDEKESEGLKNICRILNTFKVDMYHIYHPHSDKVELLDNVRIIPSDMFFRAVLDSFGSYEDHPLWVVPDAGAFKSQEKQMSKVNYKKPFISFSKSRDPQTGALVQCLSSFVPDDLNKQDVIIFDDICLGGRTFLGILNILKERNVGKVYLAISHGVLNQGVDHLREFEAIFTTDSICTIDDPLVQIYPLHVGEIGKQITVII